jgi:magnesium chelatase family protein
MQARVRTVAFQGIDVLPVDVQVLIAPGNIGFVMVGLADKAVGESRERVRAAFRALGLALPPQRITVNLSPADLAKEGSHYDLPIAVGLLVAMGVVPHDSVRNHVVLGELALDGALSRVPGVLPAAIAAQAAGRGVICPAVSGGEAAWGGFDAAGDTGQPQVIAAPSLLALINHLRGQQTLPPPQAQLDLDLGHYPDLADIKGQESAKRVLEIAAAGGHNLLMIGPPGSGKSMLAARLPGLLPPLEAEEALEASMVRSLAGELAEGKLSRRRSFRDPHHSATLQALVGGGLRARPGEVSLAHHGILFLDELPEFNRAALEALRQPLESGRVTVARANAHVTYPARFQLVAAMNPCRCGHLMQATRACGRAPRCGLDYQGKISGPCSTASTSASTCRRSAPPTSPCRRRPRRPPMSPSAWRQRAPCSAPGWPSSTARASFPPSSRTTRPACSPSACASGPSRVATPTPTARCLPPSPSPTPRARRCSRAPRSVSACRPAPGIARSGWRAPWPTSTVPTACAGCTSPRL